MLQLTQLSGLMTPRFYVAKAVNFDGSNDYMSKPGGFTGALDAKVGTISVWLRFNGGDGTLQRLFGPATGSAGLYIFKNLDNKIYVLGYNSAVAIVMNFKFVGGIYFIQRMESLLGVLGSGGSFPADVRERRECVAGDHNQHK